MNIPMNLQAFAVAVVCSQLVACDKSSTGDVARSVGEARSGNREGPAVTRVDRVRKDQPPTHNQQLRDSLDKANAIKDPEARSEALAKLAWGALDSDRDFFKRVFDELPIDSVERSELIQAHITQLAQENPDTALQWATSLETPQEKDVARNEIIQFLAGSDPKRAIQFLGRPPAGTSELDNTTLYVIHRLSAESPVDAASWVVAFPAGNARAVAVGTVASDWVQSDAKSAFSWLERLNNVTLREEAIQGVLEALAGQPEDVRNELLANANPAIRSEIEDKSQQLDLPGEESIPEDPNRGTVTEGP